ncbi:Hypothetical protein FKW44_010692, partial [Caligus rogercresseyi]
MDGEALNEETYFDGNYAWTKMVFHAIRRQNRFGISAANHMSDFRSVSMWPTSSADLN